jgi:hypothetical protein
MEKLCLLGLGGLQFPPPLASQVEVIPAVEVQIGFPFGIPGLARAVDKLCEELTATETVFPTTKLRLVYELIKSKPAGDAGGGSSQVSGQTPQPVN